MNLHPGNFHRGSSRIPYIGQLNTDNKRKVQMQPPREEQSREVGGGEHTADRTYLARLDSGQDLTLVTK